MSDSLLIEKTSLFHKFAIIDKNKNLKFFQIISSDENPKTKDIYRGKVINYNKTMRSALLDVGRIELFLQSGRTLIKGEEIFVQIDREASENKKARAKTDISISGRYVVLLQSKKGVIIPKSKNGNEEFLKIADEIKKENFTDYSIVLRSKASLEKISEIKEEIKNLMEEFDKILNSEEIGRHYCGYETVKYVLELLDRFDISKVICNEKELFSSLKKILKSKNCELKIEENLLFNRNFVKIEDFLKNEQKFSDFSLSIDYLEALTIFDINSGFMTQTAIRDNKIFEINKSAFCKVMDIIKLYKLSGIILVDFITMSKSKIKEFDEFVNMFLSENFGNKKHIEAYPVTKSCLLQLIIKNTERSIVSKISNMCENCKGTGIVLNEFLKLDKFEIELKSFFDNYASEKIRLIIPKTLDEKYIKIIENIAINNQIPYNIEREDIKDIKIMAGENYG